MSQHPFIATRDNVVAPNPDHPEIRMLAIISMIAFSLLVCALFMVNLDVPYANWIVLALTAAMITSVYIVLGLIEVKLAGKLMSMKSSAIFWACLIGILIWFSRIDALSNVNDIFAVDASLLPMATGAATFIHALIRLQYVIVITIIVSVVLFIYALYLHANRTQDEKPWFLITRDEIPWFAICHLLNILAFVLIAWLINHVLSSDQHRDQIIYRIAHSADFSSQSPCTNVNAMLNDVLYLDNAREKILVAPKIKEQEPTTLLTFSLLSPAPFTRDFKHLECKYKLGVR